MRFLKGLFALCLALVVASSSAALGVQDGLGREVDVPERVERFICSGSGCLRLATYLQLWDKVVAVDSMEKRVERFNTRPYAIARPDYRDLPLFGELRGKDTPELILSLDPSPQVIFKAGCTVKEADDLQSKTGIPVVALDYGDLLGGKDRLYRSLRTMAQIAGDKDRAEKVVAFFENTIEDLRSRTAKGDKVPTAYIGGVGFRGPHGILSTEPAYPPFVFSGVHNVAAKGAGANTRHAMVAKEALLQWDPEMLFIDLGTMTATGGGALRELSEDPIWKGLSAVKEGRIYGVMPYNLYSQNFGNILSDAYFVGSLLFPDRFTDVDPVAKADDIYRFLVGEPVFEKMNQAFEGKAFTSLEVGK